MVNTVDGVRSALLDLIRQHRALTLAYVKGLADTVLLLRQISAR
ncbi:MAG: hypothetical protein NZ693_04990 [Thermoflexales bacterium]|nr:hypothetical protein [Thermoflexales bacterium]